MHNEPPPSYNSVVLGRGQALGEQPKHNEDSNVQDNTTSDRNSHRHSDDFGPIGQTHATTASQLDDRTTKGVSETETKSDGDTLKLAGQPNYPARDTSQQPQRLGFWARIRKGLEDMTMLIIQILD